MAEQLTMFEPSGPEVLQLAATHERTAKRLQTLAETLALRGWHAAASQVLAAAADAETNAGRLYMLAEFEALGGVHA